MEEKKEERIIKIFNRNKDLIGETIIDAIFYDDIINLCRGIHMTSGYAYIIEKNTKIKYSLHRYIYYNLSGKSKQEDLPLIDHIDGNRLNNKLDNLRKASYSENNKNKTKKVDATSKYYGVSKTSLGKWRLFLKTKEKTYDFTYEKEDWAAYHYNLIIKDINLGEFYKLNKISEPNGFIIREKNIRNLPIGVKQSGNKYIARRSGKHLGTFNTITEAEGAYKKDKESHEIKLKEIKNREKIIICRNENGDAIINIYNKSKEKVGEVIVDDDKYYELINGTWSLNKGYILGYINTKQYLIHRYIMNYNGKDFIDHINNNKLDNRILNLRIVTRTQNNTNRCSSSNSSSKYIGVSYDTKLHKWKARITVNRNCMYLGSFDNEEDAAKARDIATIKYFGEHGKLNFPLMENL